MYEIVIPAYHDATGDYFDELCGYLPCISDLKPRGIHVLVKKLSSISDFKSCLSGLISLIL